MMQPRARAFAAFMVLDLWASSGHAGDATTSPTPASGTTGTATAPAKAETAPTPSAPPPGSPATAPAPTGASTAATETTPPPAPSTAPAPAPPPPPPASAPATVVLVEPPAPTDAVVHIAINYDHGVLEGRSRVDRDEWARLCDAPCDRKIRVDGVEMRVTADGMTPSNTFGIEPGPGIARFRVAGGSATARTVGLAALFSGVPISFAGMTLLGVGEFTESHGERNAGIAILAVGAAVTLVSVPALLMAQTSVKDAHNRDIAQRDPRVPLF